MGISVEDRLMLGSQLLVTLTVRKYIKKQSLFIPSYGNINRMVISIYGILAILWFIVLNFLTFQKGSESVEVSGRLAGAIKSVIGIGFYADEKDIERGLRFLAHPMGFGVLAGLSLSALIVAERSDWIAIVVALLLFWSIASEVLKIPISGRHCHGIDVIGNFIGVGIWKRWLTSYRDDVRIS